MQSKQAKQRYCPILVQLQGEAAFLKPTKNRGIGFVKCFEMKFIDFCDTIKALR